MIAALIASLLLYGVYLDHKPSAKCRAGQLLTAVATSVRGLVKAARIPRGAK